MIKKYLAAISGLLLIFGAVLVVAQGAEENAPASKDVQRAVFKVENLSCGACLSKINSALGPVEGFSGMGANLLRGMVAVDFTAPLAPKKIGEIISGIGYPATLDSVAPLTEKETFAYMQSLRQGRGYGGSCCDAGQAAAVQCPGTGAGCVIPPASQAGSGKDI